MSSNVMMQVLILVIFIFAMYFLLIRPQKKKEKTVNDMRNSLQVGDEIVTIGGICGKIVSISGDNITFETGEDRVRIQVAKWAISDRGGKEKSKESSEKSK